jgi:predicted phosphodiesterase
VKLWILNDLHLELTRGWDLPPVGARPTYDVLVLAGDIITRMERGVKWIIERVTDRPVVYVGGNHEAYGVDIDITLEKARAAAKGTNVFVLENEKIQIEHVTFLGAVGWTDFNLFADQERAMRAAGDVMNDYRKIRIDNYSRRLRPAHTLARHMETRAFLQGELSKPKVGLRVVITHHGFHAEAVSRGHEHELISAAYTSDAAIDGADLWIYGHTHEHRDFRVNSARAGSTTRVVTNAKGYGPWNKNETWENASFDVNFVIEI